MVCEFFFKGAFVNLLYIEWINNKDVLYSIENYIQYSVINHNGKEYEKEYIDTHTHIYIYTQLNHFAIQQMYSIVIQYFYRLYSIIGFYKIMGIIPCAIQYILFVYLFYI